MSDALVRPPASVAEPPASDGASARGLRFHRTLDRRLVHKAAIEQVLVDDAVRVGERQFACAAQLSRSHAYYSDLLLPMYDPLLLLEVCRQGVVLGSHEYFGVPEGWQFIFSDIHGQVQNVDALRVGRNPADCLVILTLDDERYRRGVLSSGHFNAAVELAGRPVASLDGTATFYSRERYRALRKATRRPLPQEAAPEPPVRLPPAAVGRINPQNVVIGDAAANGRGYVARLFVDQSHVTFFDHPLDHVPGALLIEALRQTSVASACSELGLEPARALVVDYTAEYSRIGELGAPIVCEADVGAAEGEPGSPRVVVGMTLRQLGASMSEARFVLEFVDG